MIIEVKFLGLCLFTVFAGHPLAILPNFDGPTKLPHDGVLEPHTAIIAFTRGTGTSSHWDIEPLRDGYDYVRIRHAALTFSGNGGRLTKPPDDLPHLRDEFCPSMWSLNPDYLPVGQFPGAEAIVHVDHGTNLRTEPTARGTILTVWSIDIGTEPLTITANGYRTLTIQPGAEIWIMHAPFKFEQDYENYVTPRGQHHFLAYYTLGYGSDGCSMHPPDVAAILRANVAKRAPIVLPPNPTYLDRLRTVVDSECSNSQYP